MAFNYPSHLAIVKCRYCDDAATVPALETSWAWSCRCGRLGVSYKASGPKAHLPGYYTEEYRSEGEALRHVVGRMRSLQ